jgi:5-amino-6-(5-phosphoribosylamino)uracil reductase
LERVVRVRPYVISSVAMSLDGHIDDRSDRRLILSGPADLDRVDEVRAGVDAILVGAGTVRRDDPGLRVRDPARVAARVATGKPAQPYKVIVTGSGNLDPAARIFTGDAPVVYSGVVQLDRLLADLAGRGVERLLVEGGTAVHTEFLTAGLVDELHVVVAPIFVGDPGAPRFVGAGAFPYGRLALAEVRRIEDVVLLRYLLHE